MGKRRTGRGSSMGAGNRKARKNRKSGNNYLTVPDKFPLFQPEPDTTVWFDFLPYEVKDMDSHPEGDAMGENVWFRYPYKIHRQVGPKKKTVVCPESIGKRCPRCERRQEIWNDPDIDKKEAKKKAKKYNASMRSLFIAKIVKIKGDPSKELKKLKGKTCIVDSSDFKFFESIDKEIKVGEEDWDNFACLEGGYTIKVRYIEETFQGNKFADPDKFDFVEKPRKDYPEKLLDKHPDLVDCIKDAIPSYDELVKMGQQDSSGSSDDIPDEDALDAMDYDDLCEVVAKYNLDSEIDPDDYDEDDDDEVEDLRAKILICLEDQEQEDQDNDTGYKQSVPDVIDDLDYDGLCDLVSDQDLEDIIDPDDFDEDEDDEVEDFRNEVVKALAKKYGDSSSDSGDSLEDLIEDNEDDFKKLKKLIKENDEFQDLHDKKIFKKFKTKPEKLAKKMLKALKGKTSSKKGSNKGKDDCPHGHTFGEEWGDHDECEKSECKSYGACFKKYDSMQDD